MLLCRGAVIEEDDLWDDQVAFVEPEDDVARLALAVKAVEAVEAMEGKEPLEVYGQLPYREAKNIVLHRFNAAYLAAALKAAGGNVTGAARTCGMERQAFQRLLRRYNMESRSFR